MRKKLIVLTGAGMSAESGLSTFRDSGGLWAKYDVKEVASIEGWYKNPSMVLEFYNKRRSELKKYAPNKGHFLLKDLEDFFEVYVITQNVDNFHERAGSKNIIHLHGELTKIKSEKNETLVYETLENIYLGDLAEDGEQLRPDIVWFGEPVPKMKEAITLVKEANVLLIIGTSLQVYPAASLIDFTPKMSSIFIIDPNLVEIPNGIDCIHIKRKASEGLQYFIEKYI